jgi:hypothetical protein
MRRSKTPKSTIGNQQSTIKEMAISNRQSSIDNKRNVALALAMVDCRLPIVSIETTLIKPTIKSS